MWTPRLLAFAWSLTLSTFWALAAPPITNAISFPRLAGAALSGQALAADEALVARLASDPSARLGFKYLVECALPAGEAVTVATPDGDLVFEGLIGLAPTWQSAPCDVACQEWVTACMMSRTNTYNVAFRIVGRGDHPALVPTGAAEIEEARRHSVEEGAFYGNMFLDPPRVYACRGRGNDPLALAFRTCTLPGSRCGMAAVGPCGSVDGTTGEAAARQACDGPDPEPGGHYTRCYARATDPETGAPSPDTEIYTRVLTTYLRPTAFQAGLTAPICEDAPPAPPAFPPPPEETAPEAAAMVGGRCSNEDQCSAPELVCETRASGGLCTQACEDTGDAAGEAEACGGEGTTCLTAPFATFCTRACTAGQPGGDCGAGRVCTLPWLLVSADGPLLPGCMPFCATDADCNPGTSCRTATGECAAAHPPPGLPAGQPCDPSGENPCSGMCWQTGGDRTQGLCAALINSALGPRCPDPGVRPYGPRSLDDLALCLYQDCAGHADCPAPLVCRLNDAGRVCVWP